MKNQRLLRKLRVPFAGAAVVLAALCAACHDSSSSDSTSNPVKNPPSLSFATDHAHLQVGCEMVPLIPTVKGKVGKFIVDPPLPQGLAIDKKTGTISGAPMADWSPTLFTVTAKNAAGSSSDTIDLTCHESFEHIRYAYTTNVNDDSISIYVVDPLTRRLHPNGYVLAGEGPINSAPYPTGEYLYVAEYIGDTIAKYRVDQNTGELSERMELAAGDGPIGIAVHPTGQYLYVSNLIDSSIQAYTLDAATGAMLPVGLPVSGAGPTQIAIEPTGRFLYATNLFAGNVARYGVDLATGQLTLLDTVVGGMGPIGLAVDWSGDYLLVANHFSDDVTLFAIHRMTGELTEEITVPVGDAPIGIAFGDMNLVYVSNFASNDVTVCWFPPMGVPLKVVGDFEVGPQPMLMRSCPFGHSLYVSSLGSSELNRFDTPGTLLPPVGGAHPLELAERVRCRPGATSVTLSPAPTAIGFEPTFAWIANQDVNDVSAFTIDVKRGELLNSGPPEAAGTGPVALAADLRSRWLYVANEQSGDLSPFSIDPLTGALKRVGLDEFYGFAPNSVSVDPSGRFVYAAGISGIKSYAIQPNGSLELLHPFGLGGETRSVAVDPTGVFVLAVAPVENAIRGFFIDAPTGELDEVDGSPFSCPGPFKPVALAFHPTGRFVNVINNDHNSVCTWGIDLDSGAVVHLYNTPLDDGPRDVAVHPQGTWLYTANFNAGTVSRLAIDPLTGELAYVDKYLVGGNPHSLSIDPAGKMLYVLDSQKERLTLFAIDPTTGGLEVLVRRRLGSGTGPVDIETTATLVEFVHT